MVVYRLDPWRTPQEWEEVYQQLYSPDIEIQRDGLRHVKLWKARTERLPLSVECTAELLQATLESGSRDSVLAAYSLAVIRFVNGQIDKAQGGVFARSVASVAVDISIPDWMIDIRHDATHKSMPGLENLRRAAKFALSWLDTRYWAPQRRALQRSREKVRALLHQYTALQRAVLQIEAGDKRANKAEITRTVEEIAALSHFETVQVIEATSAAVHETSFNMNLWRPLLVQWGKVRPENTAHLLYNLCQKSSNRLFSVWVGGMISEGLFNDRCKECFPLYIELLTRDRTVLLRNRDTCLKILNHCGDKVTGRYASLRDFLNIISSSPPTDAPPASVITKLRDHLATLTREEDRTEEEEKRSPKRFKKCGSADTLSPWSVTPLGVLPDNTIPPLLIPEENPSQPSTEMTDPLPQTPEDAVIKSSVVVWNDVKLKNLMMNVRMLDDVD